MILYLDTAGNNATIALSHLGQCLALRRHAQAMEQAAVINTLIEEVLAEGNASFKDIVAISLNGGPGSYTGLRVGMSTAKGICYAMDVPLISCNRLQLIATDFLGSGLSVAVILKARQGEYFAAAFQEDGSELLAPQHFFEEALKAWLEHQPGLLLVTDSEDFPEGDSVKVLPGNYTPNIDKWIVLAEKRFALKQFDDIAYSEPFYLKPAYTTQSKK